MSEVHRQAQVIADALEGTCDTAPSEVYELPGLAEALDELVMQCECCAWWVEVGELDADTNYCLDCTEDLS